MKTEDMSLTNNINNNNFVDRRPMLSDVEAYARELEGKLQNPGYFKWYCKVIHKISIERTRELEGRVSDAKYPGRLFTRLAKEEMLLIDRNERMYGRKRT